MPEAVHLVRGVEAPLQRRDGPLQLAHALPQREHRVGGEGEVMARGIPLDTRRLLRRADTRSLSLQGRNP